MNKIIFLLIIQLVCLPLYAYSDELPKITKIEKGQKAPYDGVLFNLAAQAQILLEKEKEKQLCDLEIDYLRMRGKADCDLKIESAKIDLEALTEKYNSINKIKDDEIERLNQIALKSKSSKHMWWMTGGVVLGVAITVASFMLASQVQKINQ